MDLFDAIHTRRSIRAYQDKPVTDADLHTLLEAAMTAPTAGNTQRWSFIVIKDRAMLDAIPDIHPYTAMIRQAPVAILVCGDASPGKYANYWPQEGGAAIQNILLAARALELGTVWCGVYPVPEREAGFRHLFRLPDHIMPMGLVIIGHPAQPFSRQERFDPTKVHLNLW